MSSPFESSPVPETNKKKDVSYTSLASDEMLFPSAIRTIDSRPTRTNVPLSFKEVFFSFLFFLFFLILFFFFCFSPFLKFIYLNE